VRGDPWLRASLAWAAAAAILAVAAYACAECGAHEIERAALAWLHERRSAALDAGFVAVTWAGSAALLVPVTLLLAWQLARRGHRSEAWFVPAALLGAIALAHAAKLSIARPRPALYPQVIDMPVDLSLPSAHALQLAAFVVALAFVAARVRPRWLMPTLATGVALLLLVAASRLYLQVHYPGDVLVAIPVAILWVTGLAALAFGRGRRRAANAP
jgi:undecaprenyl-diphosphatase